MFICLSYAALIKAIEFVPIYLPSPVHITQPAAGKMAHSPFFFANCFTHNTTRDHICIGEVKANSMLVCLAPFVITYFGCLLINKKQGAFTY